MTGWEVFTVPGLIPVVLSFVFARRFAEKEGLLEHRQPGEPVNWAGWAKVITLGTLAGFGVCLAVAAVIALVFIGLMTAICGAP